MEFSQTGKKYWIQGQRQKQELVVDMDRTEKETHTKEVLKTSKKLEYQM